MGQLEEHRLCVGDKCPGVPSCVLRDQLGSARLRWFFLKTIDDCGAPTVERRVGIEQCASAQVAELWVSAGRRDTDRNDGPLAVRHRGGAMDHFAKDPRETDREVAVQRDKGCVWPCAARNLLRRPGERRGRSEWSRLNEHVGVWDVVDGRTNRGGDVGARDDDHPLRGNHRLKATDGVLEQGPTGYQGEQRFGARRRAERPEARPDTAGEYHRPNREVGELLVDRRQLRRRQRACGAGR